MAPTAAQAAPTWLQPLSLEQVRALTALQASPGGELSHAHVLAMVEEFLRAEGHAAAADAVHAAGAGSADRSPAAAEGGDALSMLPLTRQSQLRARSRHSALVALLLGGMGPGFGYKEGPRYAPPASDGEKKEGAEGEGEGEEEEEEDDDDDEHWLSEEEEEDGAADDPHDDPETEQDDFLQHDDDGELAGGSFTALLRLALEGVDEFDPQALSPFATQFLWMLSRVASPRRFVRACSREFLAGPPQTRRVVNALTAWAAGPLLAQDAATAAGALQQLRGFLGAAAAAGADVDELFVALSVLEAAQRAPAPVALGPEVRPTVAMTRGTWDGKESNAAAQLAYQPAVFGMPSAGGGAGKPLPPQPRVLRETDLLDPALALADIDAVELARQWALIDMAMFRRIPVYEFYDQVWNKPRYKHLADRLCAFVDRFNAASKWVTATVLRGESVAARAMAVARMVNVMVALWDVKDYHGAMVVSAGLTQNAVKRLRRTMAAVPDEAKAHLERVREQMSEARSYANYRALLAQLGDAEPCVPHLAVHLMDLTFMEDGNEDELPGRPGSVNWGKWAMVHGALDSLRGLQRREFAFEPIRAVANLLEAAIAPHYHYSAEADEQANAELHSLSLVREPDERR